MARSLLPKRRIAPPTLTIATALDILALPS
jgi:hypothetical protein